MAQGGDWIAWLGRFRTRASWAVLIALVNVVGIAYGFYYYLPQFALTPPGYWPLVPDSPLAVLWAQLALGLHWARRVFSWRRGEAALSALEGLAVVGNLQVGLWTVYVLLAYAGSFGTYTLNLNTVLLAGHAAMVALGLVFLDGLRRRAAIRPRLRQVALGTAAAYYLVNDALDYFGPDFVGLGCGLRPMTVPCQAAAEPWLVAVTFALTLAGLATLAAGTRPAAARAAASATYPALDETP